MVDKHHAKHITENPNPIQLPEIGLLDVLKLLVARNQFDDGGSAEGHQCGGSGVKTGRARKQVDGQTQQKA